MRDRRGGDIVSVGHNTAGDATCTGLTAASDQTNTTPAMSATTDNAGFTYVFKLVPPANPAIDTGSGQYNPATDIGCPSHDQQNVPRPQDGDGNGTAVCDRGASEFTPDTDNDGVPDANDNCPTVPNPGRRTTTVMPRATHAIPTTTTTGFSTSPTTASSWPTRTSRTSTSTASATRAMRHSRRVAAGCSERGSPGPRALGVSADSRFLPLIIGGVTHADGASFLGSLTALNTLQGVACRNNRATVIGFGRTLTGVQSFVLQVQDNVPLGTGDVYRIAWPGYSASGVLTGAITVRDLNP